MESPEIWRWIWLIAAVMFAIGEMSTAGSFFLAPFAIGALVASILAFFGVDIALGWLAFVAVSAGTFAAFRPLARRLDREVPAEGIGAKRLIGERAIVLELVPGVGDELGLIRVNREEWRAESGNGEPIQPGTTVKVVEIRGTRAVVFPVDLGGGGGVPPIESETTDQE
ncbi:MAG: NfeD family protein [Acidimicrobiia bacterium]|nr:NfeD family protein [Acidimicrobiia bacterium]